MYVKLPSDYIHSCYFCPSTVEWVHSMGQYVDTFARYKTADPLNGFAPHPPSQQKPEKQGEGREIGEVLGLRYADKELKDDQRRDFRWDSAV